MNQSAHWKTIEEGLRGISLPSLTPSVPGPVAERAEALARWAMRMYTFSSIAHVRRILAGLVVLADAGNTPAADVICRHVFEWAASACYVERKVRQYANEQNWKAASDLLFQISGGNMWLQNHGHKYDADPIQLQAPNPVKIGKLIEAYEKHQIEQFGEGDAKDAYGFLSEHSHPNGACLRQYQEIDGWQMTFVDPPPSGPRHINRPALEWLVFIHGILALAKEDVVRMQVQDILAKTVLPAETNPSPETKPVAQLLKGVSPATIKTRVKMAKVGRNDPCPCGSGKKYKRCHGFANTHLQNTMPWFDEARARPEAELVQRERQQGFGKPIISAQINNTRLVVVKNRLLQSNGWRTFEDFLCGYIRMALGVDWGNGELAKPIAGRHPVLIWYQKFCEYQRKFTILPGKVASLPQTGASRAYLHLAYDLYALDHNADLQTKLLDRLRDLGQFTGARYEIFAAATMIRAGFDLEFEDETDIDTTHCEFTATHRRTGNRFSVEAKRCENRRIRIGRLFNGALAKRANHARIIFIDINLRDDVPGDKEPTYKRKAVARLRALEAELLNGKTTPPAYVFVTNYPWSLYLDEPEPRCTFLAEGFKIPTFKSGVTADLRSVIDAREAHIEMHELIKSMKDHAGIPSTFDGEIPEFAFHSDAPRLLIGRRYMVGPEGAQRPATMTTATVRESDKSALCGVTFEDGTSAIWTVPLSPGEMAAWRQHPDTFFGVVGQRTTQANTPLEMYDFWLGAFKGMPKEDLLAKMATSPDIDQLAELDQPRLLSIYAERMTRATLAVQPGSLPTK